MAADDIYEVKMHFEAPSGYATSRFYIQETVARSTAGTDTQVAADSVHTHMGSEVLAVMSDDWKFPSMEVNKVDPLNTPRWREDRSTPIGLRLGPALPANNSMIINLSQSLFSAKHNGRVYLPPPAEGDTTVSVLQSAFLLGVFNDLVNKFTAEILEVSAGAGRYVVGVVNTSIRDLALPAKDWQGAFSQVIGASGNPIIATQKKRQTRVRGAA